MKFKVALYPSDEGSASACRACRCWSQGETEKDAISNIAVAIREYLDAEIAPAEGVKFARSR